MSSAEDGEVTEDNSDYAQSAGHTPARGSVDHSAEPHFLAVGRISKPHGIKGEVSVELLTDDPNRFKLLSAVYINENNPRRLVIDSVRILPENVLLKFEGYPTRTEAERLRGEILFIPFAEAVPLDEGEYYLFQLVGLSVFTVDGKLIGRLTQVLETGANNVFVVEGPSGQHLIPDIPDIIKDIDIDGGRIVILPIPGLLSGFTE